MKFGGKLLNFPDSSGCDAYTYVTRIDENRFIVANKDVSSEIHGRVLKFGILSGPFVRCGGTRTGTVSYTHLLLMILFLSMVLSLFFGIN